MTGTSIAVRGPRAVVSAPVQHDAATMAPEAEFGALMELARTLVTTGFLPEAVKSPAQAVAIILTGRELGIPPMHALRSIHVIKGKPALSAELQLALFHRAGGRSQPRASDAERCVIWFRHPNGSEHEETFTVADARAAGLATDMWRKYPKAMLRARCISSGLRIVAPDIVAGLYDPEELGAVVGPSGEVLSVPGEDRPASVPPDGEDLSGDDAAPDPLAAAMALRFPFQKNTANHGKPLGEMDPEALGRVAVWIHEQQQKKGDPAWHADTLAAIRLVLGHRAREAAAGGDAVALADVEPGELLARGA